MLSKEKALSIPSENETKDYRPTDRPCILKNPKSLKVFKNSSSKNVSEKSSNLSSYIVLFPTKFPRPKSNDICNLDKVDVG